MAAATGGRKSTPDTSPGRAAPSQSHTSELTSPACKGGVSDGGLGRRALVPRPADRFDPVTAPPASALTPGPKVWKQNTDKAGAWAR